MCCVKPLLTITLHLSDLVAIGEESVLRLLGENAQEKVHPFMEPPLHSLLALFVREELHWDVNDNGVSPIHMDHLKLVSHRGLLVEKSV